MGAGPAGILPSRGIRSIARTGSSAEGGDGQKWPSRLNEVVSVSVRGGLSAIAEPSLGENIRDVMGNSIEANE